MSTTTADGFKALREPFARQSIGLLPKVSCGACTAAAKNARAARDKHCDRHTVRECPQCHNYITNGHIHIDYVGHAAVTDRLLAVDPSWTWEFATPADLAAVSPAFRDAGLWIRLTVLGVSRFGFGDAQGKTGPNAVKEAIGDALRNAAMRFGVALDLWSKDELEGVTEHVARPSDDLPLGQLDEPEQAPQARQTRALRDPDQEPTQPPNDAPQTPLKATTRARMFALFSEVGITDEGVQRGGMATILGHPVTSRGAITDEEAKAVIASLEARKGTS